MRAMKTTLRKTTGPHPLTWDELYTVLVEAEGILNSRPLAPMNTDDTAEGKFLTAGHFLIGRPLRAPPTKLSSTGKPSLLRRWNLVSRIKADF